MSLRLDGSPNNVDKNIGSVKASGDTISVTRGSTTETVALVVQGKGNDTNQDIDWYYSEKITEAKTIEKRSIQEKVKDKVYLQDEIELSSCKIWLEITDDGMLYAVEEHKHTYDGTWASNETDHWHQCTPANACSDLPDSIKDKDGHSFNDEEICTVCGYDARNGFTYHPELEATCKDTGNDEYREYKVGDEITYYQAYSAEEFGIQGARKLATISDAPIKPLNKDNHVDQNNDYKPYSKKYVKVDPSTHMIICSGCSAELGTASHDLVSNQCKDCGYTKSSNSSGGSSGSSSGSSYSNTGWIKDSKQLEI